MTAARTVARALAVGRIAFGAALLVAPSATARPWIGDDADRRGATVLGRGLGVRDLVLGLIALHTLSHPEVGPRWLRTLAACDGVDLAATLAARASLPPQSVAISVAVASGAALGELWAASRLSD
jgi:hypothetical protein